MPRCSRPWTRSSIQRAARSLSSARLVRRSGGGTLLQEPLLHVPEGSFDLAFALGVSGLTGPDLGAVELGERDGRWMQREPAALGLAERPHPVGAQTLGTPPTRSKNRTRPSKVYSRSMQRANHQMRTRDHDRMPEKHWTSPRPHPSSSATRRTSRTGTPRPGRSRSGWRPPVRR